MSVEMRERVEALRDGVERVETEISKVVVGHKDIIRGVLTCLLGGGHTLLEGVPGLGKTKMVRTMAEVLDLEFSRIQFTPDLMPADIIGTNVLMQDIDGRRCMEFNRGPIFGQLILADEINRATPKTQSALLEAMQERCVTVGRNQHWLKEPFVVMATQNPLEMEGTYPLPEAQVDRFMFKLKIESPSLPELSAIIDRTTELREPKVNRVFGGDEILAFRNLVREVPVPAHVKEWALKVVMATNPASEFATDPVKRFVRYGASPRGAQAVILSSKVLALMDGRYSVSFDDVKSSVLPALRHRIILNFEGEAEGLDSDSILAGVVKAIPELGEADGRAFIRR